PSVTMRGASNTNEGWNSTPSAKTGNAATPQPASSPTMALSRQNNNNTAVGASTSLLHTFRAKKMAHGLVAYTSPATRPVRGENRRQPSRIVPATPAALASPIAAVATRGSRLNATIGASAYSNVGATGIPMELVMPAS